MAPQKRCSLIGFKFVVRIRPKNWDADICRYAEARAWFRPHGRWHDTVEHGYVPRKGTVAMWWPEWNGQYAVYCFAFADPCLATEFRLRFG